MPLSANGLWDAETTAGQVETQPASEHRCGGRGQDAGEHRVPSPGGDPGRQGLLQHRPRLAGVANDQDLRAIRVGLQGRRPSQPDGEVRGEQLADGPPDAIGPEQSSLRHLGGR